MNLRAALLLVAPLLLLLAWALFLRPDGAEERVRSLLERGRDAFEAGDAGQLIGELHEGFYGLDGAGGLTREELRRALAGWFFAQRGGLFGEHGWSLEIPAESVRLDPPAPQGMPERLGLRFVGRFSRGVGAGAPEWEARFEVQLSRAGQGYLVQSAAEPQTLAGRAPFR